MHIYITSTHIFSCQDTTFITSLLVGTAEGSKHFSHPLDAGYMPALRMCLPP